MTYGEDSYLQEVNDLIKNKVFLDLGLLDSRTMRNYLCQVS